MRGGKSIFFFASGLFVAWVLLPVWQWLLGRALDSAARGPAGLTGIITKTVTMTAPLHPLLLGVSIGMFIALTIGYWGTIATRGHRCRVWTREIWNLMFATDGNTNPANGPITRLLLGGDVWFEPDCASKDIQITAFIDVRYAEVKWWPRDQFYCKITGPSSISIRRLDQGLGRLMVAYEIWGRLLFWRTIREWRNTDRIGKIIRGEAKKTATGLPAEPLQALTPPDTRGKT